MIRTSVYFQVTLATSVHRVLALLGLYRHVNPDHPDVDYLLSCLQRKGILNGQKNFLNKTWLNYFDLLFVNI